MGLSVSVGLLAQLREADEEGYAHYQAAFARLSELVDKKLREVERADVPR